MKCPNCGCEIPDGLLLCEECGAEIQIVPDFDPEVEISITQSLSDVAQELAESEKEAEMEVLLERKKSFFVMSIGVFFLLLLVGASLLFYFLTYRNSEKVLLEKADAYIATGNYDDALNILDKAALHQADFFKVKFRVAECYKNKGENEQYVNELLEIVKEPTITTEVLKEAYKKIIDVYDSQGKYDQINGLLQNCTEPSIIEKYSKYMASAPEFNYVGGNYNLTVPLKILANTKGKIYYTMDGTIPTALSEEYMSPIFLENGDYEITAMFVNEYGIQSPYIKETFHVDVSAPFAPEVDVYSGVFEVPQMIHAEAGEGCRIYYTEDNTEPTVDSKLYNGFLPMPLGKKTLRFIAVDEEGNTSSITVRNYELDIKAKYTYKQAASVIYQYLMISGMVIDDTGTISVEDFTKKIYSFACCVNIENEGNYYIFSEYLQRQDGKREKTGEYYAVGTENLMLYGTNYDTKTKNFALQTELLFTGFVTGVDE